MSGIDHSDIDGRLLQMLLAVLEERSVTRAAARLDIDRLIDERGIHRRFAAPVAGFSGGVPFLRGNAFLATLLGLLPPACCAASPPWRPPLPTPPMPMFMVWHQRDQAGPVRRWLRDELLAVVVPALAAAEIAPPR
jgi:hypothetical protein